jgi:catechol 2,3-dioxygenase-like lactoylglutathione lyase family enzyme
VLRLAHLNLTVSDVDRSDEFYRRWFAFDRVLAEYDDGTRFVSDASGFELGLHRGGPAASSVDWHFGFLASDQATVRELRTAMTAAGVVVIDPEDSRGYVGFKCADPDGYVVEVYFEPR